MRWGNFKKGDVETCAADEVYQAELEEIATRRRAAHNVARLDARNVKDDLVGVALSGGGVRSGAVGLGFIQGLYEKGLLPFVDYLSTVSGGGYAGAYLSSVSLTSKKADVSDVSNESESDRQAQARMNRNFPIKSEANGKQPQRILDFIFGSRYLKRTWTFTNRYLFGLLLTCLLILSGLFAICAITAWCFRWLDSPWFCSWLNAIGIVSDFTRAFVPAIVLAICWLLVWVISYWRKGARATGGVPQFFCRAMIFCFTLGFAGLIGTGDLTLPAVFGTTQGAKAEASNWSGLWMFVLSAIAASLLPYLTFGRLLRSGTNPQGPGEKYVFYVATHALCYGVPFAVFAYFAHENISEWNERRSDLLTPAELRSTDLHHPLWQGLVLRADADAASRTAATAVKTAEEASGAAKKAALEASKAALEASKATEDAANEVGNFWAAKSPRSPRAIFSYSAQESEAPEESATHNYTYQDTLNKLRILNTLNMMRMELNQPEDQDSRKPLPPWTAQANEKSPTPWDYLQEYSRQASPAKDRELSLPHRWLLLAEYGLQRVRLESSEEYSQNRISRLARNTREAAEVKWEIVDAVNGQLADPTFHVRLVPPNAILPKDIASTATDEKRIGDGGTGKKSNAVQSEAIPSINKDDDTTLWSEFNRIVLWLPGAQAPKSDAEYKQTFVDWRANVLRAKLFAESIAQRSPQLPVLSLKEIDTNVESEYPKRVGEDFGEAIEFQEEQWRRDMIAANRGLMSAYYGLGLVGPKDIVYAANVLYEDQLTRLRWFFGALVVFVLSILLIDLNFTSWHGFYSEQIGKYWIDAVPGLGNRLPLAQLETTDAGRPYHLLTGCMNQFGVPTGQFREPQVPFLFSKLFCGSNATGYEPTAGWMGGDYTLEDAVAVSGAAVSPVHAQNPLIMGLLLLFNIRLGQWVDTPGKRKLFHWFVSPLHVFWDLPKRYENRKIRFITDGGHVENLGIEPLLKRRCRLIVAVDAGQDEDYAYADFARLMRRMRLNDGIMLVTPGDSDKPLSMINMRPIESKDKERAKFVTSNVMLAEIRYPEADESDPSYLIYMKSCLTGREPLELIQIAERSDFPHDSTSDQFLTPERFDAYRLLGNYLSSTLAERIPADIRSELVRMRQAEFVDRIVSRKPIRSTPRPLNDAVKRIMQVINDKAADSFERRNAARDLINEDPFPVDVLDGLVTLLATVNEDVVDGIADAIVAAEYSAIKPLVEQLQREEPAAKFREIQRIANVLERIQQTSPDPLSHVGLVVSDVLKKTAAKMEPEQKPSRSRTKACNQMMELISAILVRQSPSNAARLKLRATLEEIARTTSHEEIRRAAEFTLNSHSS